jgi:hypothetical protein
MAIITVITDHHIIIIEVIHIMGNDIIGHMVITIILVIIDIATNINTTIDLTIIEITGMIGAIEIVGAVN